MSGEPKVSVIIPVYNAERYLPECLDSVLNQTLHEVEVICVDDGSTDGSLKILRQYENLDRRIRIFTQKNFGSGSARNLGLSVARGEFLSFMDADDCYPAGGTLESMYTALKQSGMRICGGGISLNKDGVITIGKDRGKNNSFSRREVLRFQDVQYDYGYQRFMFSRELIAENHIVFPPYLRFQDPPFLVRVMLVAKEFLAITEDTYCYRFGHQNIQWTQRKTCDLVRGIMEVLELSREGGLKQLHRLCLDRVNREYLKIISDSLREKNKQLFCLLIEFNVKINREWIDEADDDYVIKPLEELLKAQDTRIEAARYTEALEKSERLDQEIRNIKRSVSYRIGRFFTFVPRKIRRSIHCQ